MMTPFQISKDDYLQACMQLPNQYIQENTRLKNPNCQCRSTNLQIHSFVVTTELQLQVDSETQTYTGRKQGSSNDWHGTKVEEYQSLIQQAIIAEQQKIATFNDFVAYVKPLTYGTIASNQLFREHDRKFHYQYGCQTCHESGEVVCHKCDGAGSFKCNSCSGRGKTSCDTCSGTGRRTVNTPDSNGNNRTTYHHCHSCSGSGKRSCGSCGGKGKKRCSTCSGSGRLSCTECEGTGYFTEISAIKVFIHPEYQPHFESNAPESLSRIVAFAGVEKLAPLADIELLTFAEDPDKRAILLEYRVKIPVATLEIEVLGCTSQWTFFGSTPQLFDTGEILEQLLKEDANTLLQAIHEKPVWLPWNLYIAGRHLRHNLQSKVNQDILQHDIAHKEASDISQSLHNAISVDYIQKFLTAVGRFDKVQTWSFRAWYAIITLLYFTGFSLFALVLPQSDPPFAPFVSFGNSWFYRAEISVIGSAAIGLGFYALYWLHTFWHGGSTLRLWNKTKGTRYSLVWTLLTVTMVTVLIFAVGVSFLHSSS